MPRKSWSSTSPHPSSSSPYGLRAIVVAVVTAGVVGTVLLGSIRYARTATEKNHVVLVMDRIRDAAIRYKTDKTTPPVTPETEETVVDSKGPLIAALLLPIRPEEPFSPPYLDQPAVLLPDERPKQVAEGEWELRDAWGSLFRLQFDLDGDGKIPTPMKGGGPAMVPATSAGLIIYSAGPDRNFDSWQDNVCSWK